MAAREATLKKVFAETDTRFIHPLDNEQIIAGQGTTGLDFVQNKSIFLRTLRQI